MYNLFLFAVLPYLALFILAGGLVYRFGAGKYQVSSLSTQFLEGKKLFLASNFFHIGLVWLFFGHLAAFLFPRSVLAWNGEPVRLLILEISAFIFGLLSLLGLVLLIFRRFSERRLLVVFSTADLVLYLLLGLQLATGLWIALFHKWGSSWFASVLTPYLYSILKARPELEAVSQLPLAIRLHIINSWLIFMLIPFTRLVHFFALPLAYLWRQPQLVVWNLRRRQQISE